MRADAPNVQVIFFASRVQGKGAEIDVAEAMDRASRARVDVIVLTRGGGSSDDRLTFNREAVVRAILRSRHPVVTALGHLKDRHLADEVADQALATPTAAAVMLSQEWRRAFERIRTLQEALLRGYRSVLATKTQSGILAGVALGRAGANVVAARIEQTRALERRLERCSPAAWVAQSQLGVVRQNSGLDRAFDRLQQGWVRRLERANAALDAEDPTRPLARGYAIVAKDGVALRDATLLAPGDHVTARLERGTFGARVESVHAE